MRTKRVHGWRHVRIWYGMDGMDCRVRYGTACRTVQLWKGMGMIWALSGTWYVISRCGGVWLGSSMVWYVMRYFLNGVLKM